MATNPGENLSQEEIDALLAMLPADDEPLSSPPPQPAPDASVKRYDFRRTDKFSKEQIRALRMMHENLGRRMAISLSAYLRSPVEITLADIDQGTYATFLSQTLGPAIYNIVSLKPLQGQFVLEIGASLADVIIDRLLGGPGRAWERHREFTDLELALLQGAVSRILDSLAEAWSAVLTVTPKVEETLLNLYFVQVSLLTDATVWVVFEVRVGQVNGYLRLGLPYALLKPISAKLSPHAWIAGSEMSRDEGHATDREALVANLYQVPVEIIAVLGEADTPVEAITALKPGDVIPLDSAANRDIKILVAGIHRFWARPGVRGTRLAVEITRLVEPDEDS
ncbi:MAG: flagellar motor switch protein FliM [Anaerolineae bacterium]